MTTENFLIWKKKFDAELAEAKKKEIIASAEINARLSGRQYFEKHKNLKEIQDEDDEEADIEEDDDEDYEDEEETD